MLVGREKAAQVAGVTVALVIVAIVATLAARSGGTHGSAAHAIAASPSAATTPDPREAAVRAAVVRYITAYDDAFRTGDSAGLVKLTLPGSRARGDAGIAKHFVNDQHKTFVVTGLHVATLSIDMTLTTALVTADYDTTGYDAEWPSLARDGADRSVHLHQRMTLELMGNDWLLADVS